jgi:hypothetical protein
MGLAAGHIIAPPITKARRVWGAGARPSGGGWFSGLRVRRIEGAPGGRSAIAAPKFTGFMTAGVAAR